MVLAIGVIGNYTCPGVVSLGGRPILQLNPSFPMGIRRDINKSLTNIDAVH